MPSNNRFSGDPRPLADVLPSLHKVIRGAKVSSSAKKWLPARPIPSLAPADTQGELFKADKSWMPMLRAPFRQRTMARLGPIGISAYVALKARADLSTGQAIVSISTLAADTGMSARAARDGVRSLETEGLIESIQEPGRRTIYQFVERLQIVNSEGQAVGSVEWPFFPLDWTANLTRALQAAIEQLNGINPQQATINIGAINVVIVPGSGNE